MRLGSALHVPQDSKEVRVVIREGCYRRTYSRVLGGNAVACARYRRVSSLMREVQGYLARMAAGVCSR